MRGSSAMKRFMPRRVKKDVAIAGRANPKLKKALKEALAQIEGMDKESDFVRGCAEAVVKQIAAGQTIAQPVRLLTEEWKQVLIRAGIDIR